MAPLDTLLARATSSVPRPTAAQQELLVRLSRLRTLLDEGLLRVCAVKRRRFPVGASPTRRPLQPEATGAGMEVTKCLNLETAVG